MQVQVHLTRRISGHNHHATCQQRIHSGLTSTHLFFVCGIDLGYFQLYLCEFVDELTNDLTQILKFCC